MIIDLKHNKILEETMTPAFEKSVEERLIPMLSERFLGELDCVQMYEDYIADGFLLAGEWYYPFTVVSDGKASTVWVKWQMSKRGFVPGNPYAYIGDGLISFTVCDSVPSEFEEKLIGRSVYFEGGFISLKIDVGVQNIEKLSGRYSQTFIDEMTRQITREICSSQGVEGLDATTLELHLAFAPETYMEHTSENITYRRLLLTDKGCSPRDLWVKWTRLDSALAYNISDTPSKNSVRFEIGEDVPKKVREREYRYLARIDADKFDTAMSRKNVTEWREILRRAIRRGELVKIEDDSLLSLESDEALREQLSKVLGVEEKPYTKPAQNTEDIDDELIRLAREAVMDEMIDEKTEDVPIAVLTSDKEELIQSTYLGIDDSGYEIPSFTDNSEDALSLGSLSISRDDKDAINDMMTLDGVLDDGFSVSFDEQDEAVSSIFELASVELEDEGELSVESGIPEDENIAIEISGEDTIAEEELEECDSKAEEALTQDNCEKEQDIAAREERIRAEIEEKLRLEYENKIKLAREEENERLRSERELLRLENERLMEKARRDREELARAEAERLRIEEERRQAEQAERLRIEEKKRQAEELARQEAIRREKEENERLMREQAEREAKAMAESKAPKYISRTAEFTFRRTVDPNITKRIYEIVKATIEFYHKEDVYIRIKASVPDNMTVRLDFLEVPEEEGELVVNIIKVLGKSELGIAKATLD